MSPWRPLGTKPVGEASFRERETPAWGWAILALSLHGAHRLPAGRPGILGPTDCTSEPHVAKNAKLWPTLR